MCKANRQKWCVKMKNGKYTAKFGEELTKGLESHPNFQVYYDHGDSSKPNVGQITPYFRDKPYNKSTTLSNVDILITHKTNNIEKAIILIEIEETDSEPKKILGDIFNIFLAESVCFQREDFPLDQINLIVGTVVGSDDKLQKINSISNAINDLKKQIKGSIFDISIGKIELLGDHDLPELLSRIKKNILQTISEKRPIVVK